jgi:site-specific recombinase XerD
LANSRYIPIPVFDTLHEAIALYQATVKADEPKKVIRQWLSHCFVSATITMPSFTVTDYQAVLSFLYSYRGSLQTFNAYRRELERFLQWSWFIKEQSILKLKRDDIEVFVSFCIKPYKSWIGLKKVARFKLRDGVKVPNTEWRPFEASLSKPVIKSGQTPTKDNFAFSQKALQSLFAIIGSFYHYLLQEEMVSANPVALIRQKSKFIQKEAKQMVIRRLSNSQWQTVINLAKQKAKQDVKEERTVFMLSCLYGMYLRISELTASERWIPTMGDFYKDVDGNWWFKTVGKGNKARQIAVSHAMLQALKHYRTTYLKLSPLPQLDEKTPLIGHFKNANRPITDASVIRQVVQTCFYAAAEELQKTNPEEAQSLQIATVHWLRHTGISEDVKIRPREHVRDDAGHSSSAITDRYIDVELKERAHSAKQKRIE